MKLLHKKLRRTYARIDSGNRRRSNFGTPRNWRAVAIIQRENFATFVPIITDYK